MKITDEQLEIIRTFQQNRNQLAFALGVCLQEYEVQKSNLLNAVEQSKKQQHERGKDILEALGLDTVKNEYKISPDGTILVLVEGNWKEVD